MLLKIVVFLKKKIKNQIFALVSQFMYAESELNHTFMPLIH